MKDVKVFYEMPEGWRINEGALTNPNGTKWISTGSLLGGNYKHALLVVDPEVYAESKSKM